VENIWQFLRQNFLSNRVYGSYEAIVDAYIADPACGFGIDAEATKALFAKYKPTHVIHLAALGA